MLTFQWRLHGGLHQSGQELERLGVLGQAGREGGQSLGVFPQALQGHAFTVVRLQQHGRVRRGEGGTDQRWRKYYVLKPLG